VRSKRRPRSASFSPARRADSSSSSRLRALKISFSFSPPSLPASSRRCSSAGVSMRRKPYAIHDGDLAHGGAAQLHLVGQDVAHAPQGTGRGGGQPRGDPPGPSGQQEAHVILTKPSQRGDVLNALSSPWSARLLAKRIGAPDPAGIGAPLFVGHCSRGQRRLRAGAEDEDHGDDREDCSNHWISSVCTLRSR
jgi:hypothetical protein